MLSRIKAATAVYWNRRQLTIMGMGFSSGFPFFLLISTLGLWLAEAGVPLQIIGFFALVRIPYSVKWLWSPLVDRLDLPLLGRLGRRRGWALLAQVILLAGIWGMALTDPAEHIGRMMMFALLTAFASATQDIVLDAYRVESFELKEQGAASAVFMVGYRLGTVFSGALALILAAYLSWEAVYLLMSLGAVIGMLTVLVSPEPPSAELPAPAKENLSRAARLAEFFRRAVRLPLQDFIGRPGWALILLLIMIYKLCDAYMAPMAMPFYDAMGFSKIEIAAVTKIYGVAATIAGSLLGGLLVARQGLLKTMIIGSLLMGLTTLMFAAQTYAGHNLYMLMLTISLDNLAGGLSSTALVAYISAQCNVAFTATQYALLSSFMSLMRDSLAATSGLLVEATGWVTFFVITTLLSLPGLWLVIYLAKRDPKLQPAATDNNNQTL